MAMSNTLAFSSSKPSSAPSAEKPRVQVKNSALQKGDGEGVCEGVSEEEGVCEGVCEEDGEEDGV